MRAYLLLPTLLVASVLYAEPAAGYFAEDFKIEKEEEPISIHEQAEREVTKTQPSSGVAILFEDKHVLTRKEFVAMLMSKDASVQELEYCYRDITSVYPPNFRLVFTDVLVEDHYAKHICLAMKEGVITYGPSQAFRPNDAITVAEAVTMLARYYELRPYAHMDSSVAWYQHYLQALTERGAIPASVRSIHQTLTVEELHFMRAVLDGERVGNPLVEERVEEEALDSVIVGGEETEEAEENEDSNESKENEKLSREEEQKTESEWTESNMYEEMNVKLEDELEESPRY